MPESIVSVLEVLALIVEGIGYAILTLTVVKFTVRYVSLEFQRLRGYDCARQSRHIRLDLLGHIVLAIDFMVISDIIYTGLAETRDSLITLGLFVLIRSMLAFFIGLDMKDIREEDEEAEKA